MSTPSCQCGAVVTHDDERACCWCYVVELGRDASPLHRECSVAADRIAKVQQRFRGAVLAEREACARVVENARAPLEAMPLQLRLAARRDPDRVVGAVVDLVAKNVAALIRSRIDPVPSARGRA